MNQNFKTPATNSTYKKLAVHWLNGALCFVSSLVVADSFRLRNRQLLVAAKRYRLPFYIIMNTYKYLSDLKNKILDSNNWKKIQMDKTWLPSIPSEAGVYVLREEGKIVYVGETGNLRGRMKDLLDTRNHSVRRTIGKKLFSSENGFKEATTKVKFPNHIEVMVNTHFLTNLSIAYLCVTLGRKELEELIEQEIDRSLRLNKRGKRK
jgi:hypothetical protein